MNIRHPVVVLATLLLSLAAATRCHGRAKTNLPVNSHGKPKAIQGQPRLVRTQGVASGNVGCMLQDRERQTWFGTGGFGLARYSRYMAWPI